MTAGPRVLGTPRRARVAAAGGASPSGTAPAVDAKVDPRAGAAFGTEPQADAVFDSAAELFRLLATPIRLKIISALCEHEKNVSQLLAEIDTTQPNMSQHLSTLYRAGVLARRRDATQVHYRIGSERAATLCRAVCMQIALDDDEAPAAMQAHAASAASAASGSTATATAAPRRDAGTAAGPFARRAAGPRRGG